MPGARGVVAGAGRALASQQWKGCAVAAADGRAPLNTALQATASSHDGRKAAGIPRRCPMNAVTALLDALPPDEPATAAQPLPAVYNDLRRLAAAKLAHEGPGQTLEPTALVHEAFLRLTRDKTADHWDNRGHFFAAAAEAMRRILVEN